MSAGVQRYDARSHGSSHMAAVVIVRTSRETYTPRRERETGALTAVGLSGESLPERLSERAGRV